MADQESSANPASTDGGVSTGGSVTRGFLFADLRGYTDFVETQGAAAAAELLSRYRTLTRSAVRRFAGAEIKTEGDSFYVAFPSVSNAVRCGLAIADEARTASPGRSDPAILVGIGIHAGETIESEGGYVGSPVNIAARICALAAAGEVLVSDTVRTLTQSVLPVSFEPRGRRHLKGVAEPIALYSVTSTAGALSTTNRRGGRSRRGAILAVAGIAVLLSALVGGWALLRPTPGLPGGPWIIGLDAPLTQRRANLGIPVRNAVKLAIDDADAAGGIGGAQIVLDARDDSEDTDRGQSIDRGVANATAFAADPRTIAMIGALASPVTTAMIPVTNRAGLLECSPTNTLPGLTKPRSGALDLRSAAPGRINYVRTAPSDDIQGPALASFVLDDLGVMQTLVIDDTRDGRQVADDFTSAYTRAGGSVIRRALNPGADPTTVLDSLSAPDPPGAVFFGGFTDTGAPQIRAAMAAAGHGAIPFLNWDGIMDGSGAETGSYINLVGGAAPGTYMSHASIGPLKASFSQEYRAAYGSDPDEYAAASYACTQVILDALRSVARTGPGADELREEVRASAVDPAQRYDTVIGTLGFDANGDLTQQFVTFYRVDPSAADGKGDWVVAKQQDYGPAP